MNSTDRSRPSPLVVAGQLVGALTVANVLTNRVLPSWSYVPFNLLLTAVVVVLASRVVTPAEMGFANWRRGAVWGIVLAAATFVVLLIVVMLPPTSDLFDDRRVDDGVAALAYNTLLAIPLGTVLLEEVSFRGVLPAVLDREWSTAQAVVASSALFGAWHVLPSWGIADVNPVVEDILGAGWTGRMISIGAAVGGTFLVGLWWSFVRFRSGSLLAPVLAHIATNSLAYSIAWTVA